MTVVAVVVLCLRARLQAHLEAGEDGDEVPLELQQGVTLAWAESAERDDWVLQFLSVLREGRVDEAVVLKDLQREDEHIVRLIPIDGTLPILK